MKMITMVSTAPDDNFSVQHPTVTEVIHQILTKDSVTVFVNAIMYYKVSEHHFIIFDVVTSLFHHVFERFIA